MPDILQDFPIKAPPARVFECISTPAGLDQWWTSRSTGGALMGESWEPDFEPGYLWRATVTDCEPPRLFELTLDEADTDWTGSRVAFDLVPSDAGTQLRFSHRGWPAENEHYRISCHCWALYLRLLRRRIEFGERVPYDMRLDA